MMSSKSKYAFIALVAASFLYSGCQKSAHRTVKGTLKPAGSAQTDAQQKAIDQQIEALIQKGTSSAQCSTELTTKSKNLKIELDKANQMAADNQGKDLDDATQKKLTDQSALIQRASQSLMAEFLKAKIATCGSKDSAISLADIRSNSQATILALAKALGKDTDEAGQVKDSQQASADAKQPDSLVQQVFKVDAKLAKVLTAGDEENSLFVMDGAVANTKEHYEEALKKEDKTVCLLTMAPEQSIEEKTEVKVMSAEVAEGDALKKASNGTDLVLVHTTNLNVSLMGSDVQIMEFTCRLGKGWKTNGAPSEFSKAFRSLLVK
jgi:hypothetical protein